MDGFVIGALGSWDPDNDAVPKKLGIGTNYAKMFRKLCCMEAIKGSYAIWRAKMDDYCFGCSELHLMYQLCTRTYMYRCGGFLYVYYWYT